LLMLMTRFKLDFLQVRLENKTTGGHIAVPRREPVQNFHLLLVLGAYGHRLWMPVFSVLSVLSVLYKHHSLAGYFHQGGTWYHQLGSLLRQGNGDVHKHARLPLAVAVIEEHPCQPGAGAFIDSRGHIMDFATHRLWPVGRVDTRRLSGLNT